MPSKAQHFPSNHCLYAQLSTVATNHGWVVSTQSQPRTHEAPSFSQESMNMAHDNCGREGPVTPKLWGIPRTRAPRARGMELQGSRAIPQVDPPHLCRTRRHRRLGKWCIWAISFCWFNISDLYFVCHTVTQCLCVPQVCLAAVPTAQ